MTLIVLSVVAIFGWLGLGCVGYLYLVQERRLMFKYAEHTEEWLCDTSRSLSLMRDDCDRRVNEAMDRVMAHTLQEFTRAKSLDKRLDYDQDRVMAEIEKEERGTPVPVPEERYTQVGITGGSL